MLKASLQLSPHKYINSHSCKCCLWPNVSWYLQALLHIHSGFCIGREGRTRQAAGLTGSSLYDNIRVFFCSCVKSLSTMPADSAHKLKTCSAQTALTQHAAAVENMRTDFSRSISWKKALKRPQTEPKTRGPHFSSSITSRLMLLAFRLLSWQVFDGLSGNPVQVINGHQRMNLRDLINICWVHTLMFATTFQKAASLFILYFTINYFKTNHLFCVYYFMATKRVNIINIQHLPAASFTQQIICLHLNPHPWNSLSSSCLAAPGSASYVLSPSLLCTCSLIISITLAKHLYGRIVTMSYSYSADDSI